MKLSIDARNSVAVNTLNPAALCHMQVGSFAEHAKLFHGSTGQGLLLTVSPRVASNDITTCIIEPETLATRVLLPPVEPFNIALVHESGSTRESSRVFRTRRAGLLPPASLQPWYGVMEEVTPKRLTDSVFGQ